jgi:hypothetical protein
MELCVMQHYLFRDEQQAFFAKRRREVLLEKAAGLYYTSTDSGNPQFDELTPDEQERWVRKVTSGE